MGSGDGGDGGGLPPPTPSSSRPPALDDEAVVVVVVVVAVVKGIPEDTAFDSFVQKMYSQPPTSRGEVLARLLFTESNSRSLNDFFLLLLIHSKPVGHSLISITGHLASFFAFGTALFHRSFDAFCFASAPPCGR